MRKKTQFRLSKYIRDLWLETAPVPQAVLDDPEMGDVYIGLALRTNPHLLANLRGSRGIHNIVTTPKELWAISGRIRYLLRTELNVETLGLIESLAQEAEKESSDFLLPHENAYLRLGFNQSSGAQDYYATFLTGRDFMTFPLSGVARQARQANIGYNELLFCMMAETLSLKAQAGTNANNGFRQNKLGSIDTMMPELLHYVNNERPLPF